MALSRRRSAALIVSALAAGLGAQRALTAGSSGPARSPFSATTPTPAKSAARCSRASSPSATACSGPKRTSGVAATQAIVDVSYGPKALALLRAGMSPSAIIKAILDSDPDPARRAAVAERRASVRRDGREGELRRAHGPEGRRPGPGHKGGKFCTAQGNILAGEAVVTNMVDAFENDPGAVSRCG